MTTEHVEAVLWATVLVLAVYERCCAIARWLSDLRRRDDDVGDLYP